MRTGCDVGFDDGDFEVGARLGQVVRTRQASAPGADDHDVRNGSLVHHVEVAIPDIMILRSQECVRRGSPGSPLNHGSRYLSFLDRREAVLSIVVLRHLELRLGLDSVLLSLEKRGLLGVRNCESGGHDVKDIRTGGCTNAS